MLIKNYKSYFEFGNINRNTDLFSDIEIYWYIEEPGCQIYETNDSTGEYFPQRYCVEYIEDGDFIDTYYPESEKELYEITSSITNRLVTDWKSLDKFNENEDTYFIVNEIEII